MSAKKVKEATAEVAEVAEGTSAVDEGLIEQPSVDPNANPDIKDAIAQQPLLYPLRVQITAFPERDSAIPQTIMGAPRVNEEDYRRLVANDLTFANELALKMFNEAKKSLNNIGHVVRIEVKMTSDKVNIKSFVTIQQSDFE